MSRLRCSRPPRRVRLFHHHLPAVLAATQQKPCQCHGIDCKALFAQFTEPNAAHCGSTGRNLGQCFLGRLQGKIASRATFFARITAQRPGIACCRFCRRPIDYSVILNPRIVKGRVMQYLLLIYENEANRQNIDRAKMGEEYGKFTKSIIESGNFKGGDALQPTTTATTVRLKDGKPVTTHGPFAETREALIGYYLIEAKDLDQATGIAARVPSAKIGSIEVRPIMVYN